MAKIVPIPVKPMWKELDPSLKPSVEKSGHGDLLCYDGFSGRWFRASKAWVDRALSDFQTLYNNHDTYLSWNDLYELLDICRTDFGNRYGYSPSEEYDVGGLEFNCFMDDSNFEGMGEPVYIFELRDEYCFPYDYYMEV